MSRPSFLRDFASWIGAERPPTRARRGAPAFSIPEIASTPQQLDGLTEALADGRDHVDPATTTAWPEEDAQGIDRQARFLRTVDRAIAEIEASRDRRGRVRILARVRARRGESDAFGDRRDRSRTGPGRRPA